MHYKIFSFLFLISIGFNQSFFYKSVGNDVFSHSPRSLGLGYNLGLGAKDGFALNGNPANLINKEKEITVYLNSNYEGVSERRSFILKDSFGDFLTDADYNVNSNRVLNYSTGITYNSKISNNLFSIGVNYSPILDFNSKFREEVRGSLSCDEGIPCTRDVLSGYHNFSTDGTIYGILTGGATEITTEFGAIKLGLSLLNTSHSEINYNFSVDTLLNDWSNLSKILPHQNKVDIASTKSTNFGFLFESKYGIDLSYFYHNSIDYEVKDEFPFGFINEESGLIEYIYDYSWLI